MKKCPRSLQVALQRLEIALHHGPAVARADHQVARDLHVQAAAAQPEVARDAQAHGGDGQRQPAAGAATVSASTTAAATRVARRAQHELAGRGQERRAASPGTRSRPLPMVMAPVASSESASPRTPNSPSASTHDPSEKLATTLRSASRAVQRPVVRLARRPAGRGPGGPRTRLPGGRTSSSMARSRSVGPGPARPAAPSPACTANGSSEMDHGSRNEASRRSLPSRCATWPGRRRHAPARPAGAAGQSAGGATRRTAQPGLRLRGERRVPDRVAQFERTSPRAPRGLGRRAGQAHPAAAG